METMTIIKDYLEKKNVAAACRAETVFVYQAQLNGESRLSGCEMQLKEMGGDLVLTALLPISVRVKEARGVTRWLADLNDSRLEPGFFELDNLAGRIQFRVRMHGPLSEEQLEIGLRYCLEQVEAQSDEIVSMVCKESSRIHEQELAALRKRQAAEASTQQTPLRRLTQKALAFIGLLDEPAAEFPQPAADDLSDDRPAFQPEEQPAPQAEAPEEEIFIEPVFEEDAEQPAPEEKPVSEEEAK